MAMRQGAQEEATHNKHRQQEATKAPAEKSAKEGTDNSHIVANTMREGDGKGTINRARYAEAPELKRTGLTRKGPGGGRA